MYVGVPAYYNSTQISWAQSKAPWAKVIAALDPIALHRVFGNTQGIEGFAVVCMPPSVEMYAVSKAPLQVRLVR